MQVVNVWIIRPRGPVPQGLCDLFVVTPQGWTEERVKQEWISKHPETAKDFGYAAIVALAEVIGL